MAVSIKMRQLDNGIDNVANATLEMSEILHVNGEKERQLIVVLQR